VGQTATDSLIGVVIDNPLLIPMEVITSISNSKVQALRALYTKKGRDEANAYVLEGVNIVKDIPAEEKVLAYYLSESKREELAFVLKDKSVEVYVLADDLLKRVADTISPSGVVAVLAKPQARDGWKRAEKLLVLDGVSDPGNVGTILRTAIAAGYPDVLLLGGADPYSPKVVRASMGAIYRLRVYEEVGVDPEDINKTVYLLDMAGENIFDTVPQTPYALVVGSEAKGASEAMRRRADKVVSIPMSGGIESLNAAVAAAIGMYQLNVNAK